jgi:hypothetical protein
MHEAAVDEPSRVWEDTSLASRPPSMSQFTRIGFVLVVALYGIYKLSQGDIGTGALGLGVALLLLLIMRR